MSVALAHRRTIKTPLIRNVIHQQNAHGATVVGGSDGAEALLPRRVPDLQLDALAVQLDGSYLEVDADGCDEGRGEGVFAEAQQTARLAHARVADEEEFDLGASVLVGVVVGALEMTDMGGVEC